MAEPAVRGRSRRRCRVSRVNQRLTRDAAIIERAKSVWEAHGVPWDKSTEACVRNLLTPYVLELVLMQEQVGTLKAAFDPDPVHAK